MAIEQRDVGIADGAEQPRRPHDVGEDERHDARGEASAHGTSVAGGFDRPGDRTGSLSGV